MVKENYYSVEQIAEKLLVSPETIRVWLREKRLKGIKIGRQWRIPESSLEEFLRR